MPPRDAPTGRVSDSVKPCFRVLAPVAVVPGSLRPRVREATFPLQRARERALSCPLSRVSVWCFAGGFSRVVKPPAVLRGLLWRGARCARK